MPWSNVSARTIFHHSFKAKPFWWEAYEPQKLPETPLPKDVPVAIVGAGYAGLNAAIELAKLGSECLVLDAAEPGFGGSTRNGGQVSGGVSVGKRIINRALTPEEAKPFLNDAVDAFSHIENVINENKIDCGWTKSGYFLGAWSQSHFDAMAKKIGILNEEAQSGAMLVPRERQREEIGSDYYFGGMAVSRAAHLHPALYFKGLLDLARNAGIAIASNTPVIGLTQESGGTWQVKTPRGTIRAGNVIIATNGYTGDITPEGMAQSLSPKNRSFADTRRVLTYYRLSPDGKRLIFGGRAKFGFTDPVETAPLLFRFMTDRFPQLKGVKVTHAWTGNVAFAMDELPHMGKRNGLHFALACNGSGIAMMSYLGRETARKVLGKSNRRIAFDRDEFPTHLLYNGNPWFLPLVGAWFRTADWWDRRFK
jgi:glycine/D-amino acid oxidase-like deaminating enzyme